MTMRRGVHLVSGSIERRIHVVRGEKVLFDADLAALYAVTANDSTSRSSATDDGSRAISCSG